MAAMVEAPGHDAIDVHDWLERVIEGRATARTTSSPLAAACSSAVDPLEIAVALEVAGISHAVVTERYGRADVFSLAGTLWNRIPLRPMPAKPVKLPRSGDRRDLARGLLYAVPALMLLALTSTFDLALARWVLPLAISWGWGLGQVAAFVGYRMQGGEHTQHEANVVGLVMAGAVGSTTVLSAIAALAVGGGATAVAAATALVTYMVASAILLVRSDERWLAILLLPGTLASPIVLAMSQGSLPARSMAAIFVGGSFLAVVGRALRNVRVRKGSVGRAFGRRDIVTGSGHLLHGVLCGLAVALVVIHAGPARAGSGFTRMLLPMPLLATLGVMEWQLRTFGSRVARLTHSLESCRDFPRLAWHQLVRSLAICVAANATVAVAAMIAVRIHGGDIAIGPIMLQCALGAVFFTDLIVVLLGRLDLVLRSWLAGLAVGCLAALGLLVLTESVTDVQPYLAGSAVISVVIVSLLFHARQVVSAAMSY
jgi:hypothetical protein